MIITRWCKCRRQYSKNAGLNALPRTHCTILLQRYSYVTVYLGLLFLLLYVLSLPIYLYMYGCALYAVLRLSCTFLYGCAMCRAYTGMYGCAVCRACVKMYGPAARAVLCTCMYSCAVYWACVKMRIFYGLQKCSLALSHTQNRALQCVLLCRVYILIFKIDFLHC